MKKIVLYYHQLLTNCLLNEEEERMLESPTIQKTIYLYWANYPEFSDIQEAVKFSQRIYMAEHRNIFELCRKYMTLFHKSQIPMFTT
jgi:hypothetical protein